MYPYLFGIEGIEMYYIMIGVGIFVALYAFRIVMKYFKIDVEVYNFYLKLSLVAVVVGFVFAFLFQQLYNWIEAIQTGTEYQMRGLTLMGGVFGGIATWLIGVYYFAQGSARKHFFLVTNVVTFSVMIGHMFGRIGCFCAGCCYGIHTDEWYGMYFPTHDHTVVPTQLYEALFMMIFVLIGIFIIRAKKINYMLFSYFIVYPIFRFLIEFVRDDERGSFLPLFSPSQWLSIFMLVATTLLLIKYLKKPFETGYQA